VGIDVAARKVDLKEDGRDAERRRLAGRSKRAVDIVRGIEELWRRNE